MPTRRARSLSLPDTSPGLEGSATLSLQHRSSSSHLWGRHRDCPKHPSSCQELSEVLKLVPRVFVNLRGVPALRKRLRNNTQTKQKVPGGRPAETIRDFKESGRRKWKNLFRFVLLSRLGDSSSLLFIHRGIMADFSPALWGTQRRTFAAGKRYLQLDTWIFCASAQNY